MKAKSGKVLALAIGSMPQAMLPTEGERPVYPIYSLAYNPQNHQILDVFLIEDYETEHGKFISRLLEIFEKDGKPQAIHCYGKRTLPLLSKMGKQIGIMVVNGTQTEQMGELIQEMFHELTDIPHEHEHEHHHHHHLDHEHCDLDHEHCDHHHHDHDHDHHH